MVRFMKNKRLTIGVLIGNANSPHAKMLMKGIYDVAKKMTAEEVGEDIKVFLTQVKTLFGI